jgi:hypothetical protein
MFNLDVAELDNYYVGEYDWLVHNFQHEEKLRLSLS